VVTTLLRVLVQTKLGWEPAFRVEARNVTLAPEQILFVEGVRSTVGVRLGFTVVAMLLDVAGDPVRQGEALDVMTTDTMFPFERPVVVYVVLLEPTLDPFSFH